MNMVSIYSIHVCCLQAQARGVEQMRDRMFSGDKINITEVCLCCCT